MTTLSVESVGWIVVHGSATNRTEDIGMKELRHIHMLRGAPGIGYHYVIRRDGKIETGLSVTTPGNHAPGFNLHSLGICMIGGRKGKTNRTENNFTKSQFISLRKILSELRDQGFESEVVGHCDLAGVKHSCPGFDVREWHNKE